MIAGLPAHIGKYEVERLLGSGGMGRVLLARDPVIGRQVAIKQINTGTDPQAQQRFLREAQTMGRLNHPNITTLLEFGLQDDSPYLVLELLSGEDLSQWMRRPHTLREQLTVMLDIARGLQAAHQAGILHRDLKPDNVRVLENGHCKLLDFGIADTGGEHLTASGYFVGTPDYLAPEVITGQAHSQASDLYALGLLCYVLLKGDNPLHAETIQATIARVVHHQPPSLDRCVIGVPAPLAQVIDRCLDKQPALRPPTIDALIEVLERCQATTPAEAQVSVASADATQPVAFGARRALPSPTASQAPRRRWWVALAAAVLLLVWARLPPPQPPVAVTADAPATQSFAEPEPAPVLEPDEPARASPPSTPAGEVGAKDSAPVAAPRSEPVQPARSRPEPVSSAQRAGPRSDTSATVEEPALISSRPAAPPIVADQALSADSLAQPESQSAPAATVQPTLIEVLSIEPQVIRAGRSTRVRLTGTHLDGVSDVTVSAGGTADSRFRIGELRHSGNAQLEFTLSVARGVPLGSYALSLRGDAHRSTTVLFRVSL